MADEDVLVMEPKQVIVVRHDLKMRKGKVAAQVAHASMKIILDLMGEVAPPSIGPNNTELSLVLDNDDPLLLWIDGVFAKIVARVESEEELLEIERKAREAGIRTALITDAGRTEFHGVPTNTCVAIGPDDPKKIDKITGHLKLI